ncbi:MAG: hypothetical protein SPF22_07535 [Candidatus Onthovivens sp.]|nr:hypothetical protein [Candidatus Onthovivens sp.]
MYNIYDYNWVTAKDFKANADEIYEIRAKWRHEFALALGDPEYRKDLLNLMLKIINGINEKISKIDKIDKSLFKDFCQYIKPDDLKYQDTLFLFRNSSSLAISLGEYIYNKIKSSHKNVTDENEILNDVCGMLWKLSVDSHFSEDAIMAPISDGKTLIISKAALYRLFGDEEDQLKIDKIEYALSEVSYEDLEDFLTNNVDYSYIPFYLYTHHSLLMTKIIDLGNMINSDSPNFSNIEKLTADIRSYLSDLDEWNNQRYPIFHSIDNEYNRGIDIDIIINFLNDLLGTAYNKNGIRAYFYIHKGYKNYSECFVTNLLVNMETKF